MPLTRSIANPPVATPKGVDFTLKDRSKLVRCLITHQALEKLARGNLEPAEFEHTFHHYRDRIEGTASRKYDSSPTLRSPFTISPSDLVIYHVPAPMGRSSSLDLNEQKR